ncbi:unnamed protein product [Amoebophrya sp. A120]|nr:unnamed protein product [Amoebophrya sp. A120]|eukprot:GSA120T00003426001.1
MPLKQQDLNDAMENDWAIGLTQAPCTEPAQCCLAFWCLPGCPCVSGYLQRKELMKVTGEPYVCCGGMFPCGPLKDPQDENCLFCEACCCPHCAVVANRYIVQTRFSIRNGPCDEFILTFMCIVSWTICILETAGYDVPDEIEVIVDLLIDIVYACMHAQQHHQIELIKKTVYKPPSPQVIVMLPPVQQNMIANAKIVAQPGAPVPPQQYGQAQPYGQGQYGYQGQQMQVQQQPMYYQQPQQQQMYYQQAPPNYGQGYGGQQHGGMQPLGGGRY